MCDSWKSMRDNLRRVTAAESLRSLARDARGAIPVYVAVCAPMLLGIGALSVDLGRVMTVNTELQNAADAAALAGAQELDHLTGAMDRARAVAVGAVANLQTFATGGAEVTIDPTDCADPPVAPCIRFLKGLPASDGDPITALNLAATDEEARYIEVHVATRTVTNELIRLVGGPATSATSASAVAGKDEVICKIPPMWMCNPTEPPGNTDTGLPVELEALKGRQIRSFLQAKGPYTPGNFGILCPAGTENGTCGADDVARNIASVDGTCVGANPLATKPGVTLSAVRAGINARMDYWTTKAKDNDNGDWRFNNKFAPAVNVTQGGEPEDAPSGSQTDCDRNDLPAGQAMGLARDQCLVDGTCADPLFFGNPAIGDRNWDHAEYFRINHGGDGSPGYRPPLWPGDSQATGPTRFEVYRYEVERGAPDSIVTPGKQIVDAGGNPVATTAENGHAQCFQGTPPVNGYNYYPDRNLGVNLLKDRRLFPLAIANCNALGNAGDDPNGKFEFYPADYLLIFVTEPAEPPTAEGKVAVLVEAVGRVPAGHVGSLTRQVVQLYRR